jgi:small conductance mechanosensitive channel
VIPNRKVAGEVFHNYGGMRQLQLTIYVGYDADLQLALSTIHEVLDANCRVLREPVALVQPVQLAEWSVEISARPWVLSRDGFAAKGEIHCQILERFRDRGIVIPVPKRELRIVGEGIRPFTVIQGDRTG